MIRRFDLVSLPPLGREKGRCQNCILRKTSNLILKSLHPHLKWLSFEIVSGRLKWMSMSMVDGVLLRFFEAVDEIQKMSSSIAHSSLCLFYHLLH